MFEIIPLAILVLDIFVILQIVKGGGDSTKKLIWILAVIFLPVLGPILYFVLNERGV